MTDPVAIAALGAQQITLVGLMQIDLPGYTLRLNDCGADLSWGGNLFVADDDRFGSVIDIDTISSGTGDNAPRYLVTMSPKPGAGLAQLSNPLFQGAQFRAWLAPIDPVTGQPIGEPIAIAFGFVDTSALKIGQGERLVELDIVSGFERFFEDDEGQRLSDSWHQSIWPGELGMANATGVTIRDAWGTRGAGRGASVTPAGAPFRDNGNEAFR